MNKKNLILGGVLVALIIIAFLWQGPLKNWEERQGQVDNFLAELSVASVSRIEILSGGNEIALEKTGERKYFAAALQ